MMEAKATEIREGDRVTYCGVTFVVQSRATEAGLLRFDPVPGSARGTVTGMEHPCYPQYIDRSRMVKIERVPPVEKPYFVVTRDYDEKGDADKRTFRFRTAAQQGSFMSRTRRCITFHN